jgi:uncharacterized membrane protein
VCKTSRGGNAKSIVECLFLYGQVLGIEAIKRVPELFKEMDVDELAKVLETGMGDAVLQEVRRGMRQ